MRETRKVSFANEKNRFLIIRYKMAMPNQKSITTWKKAASIISLGALWSNHISIESFCITLFIRHELENHVNCVLYVPSDDLRYILELFPLVNLAFVAFIEAQTKCLKNAVWNVNDDCVYASG